MTEPALQLATFLASFRMRYTNERQLQDGVEQALTRAGYQFQREAPLSAGDRVDFLLGAVALEVKVARRAGARAVLEQLDRYAGCERVAALILLTDRTQLAAQPHRIRGKPLYVVKVRSGLV